MKQAIRIPIPLKTEQMGHICQYCGGNLFYNNYIHQHCKGVVANLSPIRCIEVSYNDSYVNEKTINDIVKYIHNKINKAG